MASLPWVDQNSKNIHADTGTQKVRFGVPDMSKFDEQQLKDAFKKNDFPTIEVLSKSKA
ncbi:MAG: hypothetical protein L0Y71_23940 [Gemmataceae bacterium]|nr:hypothetical protein [Gemmataceae bacterium]